MCVVSVIFLATYKILEFVAFCLSFILENSWPLFYKYFSTLSLFSYLFVKLFDIAHQPSGTLFCSFPPHLCFTFNIFKFTDFSPSAVLLC